MSTLIKDLKEQKGYSESEKMIAEFMLENYRGIAAMSTRQMAKKTYTSPSAIVRFSQKMGFEGYTDFKVQFLAEMMQYMNQPSESEVFTSRDTVRNAIEKATRMELNAIKETNSQLEPSYVVKILQQLIAVEHIDFYATDENLNIARHAASNFVFMEKSYTVPLADTQMYFMSVNVSKRHFSVLISRTGENRMLIDAAHNIKARGGKMLLITGEKDSTLGRLADFVLVSASSDRVEALGYRIWWVCARYLVDMLMAAMITQRGLDSVGQRDEWLKKNFVI